MRASQNPLQDQMNLLLTAGDILGAEALLNQHSFDPALWSQRARLKAKIHLYRSQYSAALSLLKQAEETLPEDLSLASDICLCLYQLGFKTELAVRLDQIKVQIFMDTLNSQSSHDFDSGLLIAKILEEFGDFKSSQQILNQLELFHLNSWQMQSLEIQRLRQAVEVQDLIKVEKLYNQLSSGTQQNLSFNLEKEHVLMLAGIELFGISHGLERYSLVKNQFPSLADQSFFMSEIMEKIILSSKLEMLQTIAASDLPETESLYEKTVFKISQEVLIKSQDFQLPLTALEKDLPPISFLRLLRLILKTFPQHPQLNEINSLFTVKLKAIPEKKLQEQFRKSLGSERLQKIIRIDINKGIVEFESKQLKIKNKLIHYLLEQLQNHSMVTIDSIAKSFYQEELNSQHFDRIRITVYRFNSQAKEELLLDDLFQITKNSVQLCSQTFEYRS